MAEPLNHQVLKEGASVNLRKSSRDRKKKRSYSPEASLPTSSGQRKRGCGPHKWSPVIRLSKVHEQDQQTPVARFRCDLCSSPTVAVSRTHRLPGGAATKRLSPRYHLDPTTSKVLTLCNACGLSLKRPKKPRKEKIVPSEEDKQNYLRQMRVFSKKLSIQLGDNDAELLYCPSFTRKPCGCIQRYLTTDESESLCHARKLLALLKQARDLKTKKCYSLPLANKKARRGTIGLGNGQKHSPEYTSFVLEQRGSLKERWQLCERACQRLLGYSNNFLHKPLKTEQDERRAVRLRGKAGLGLLPRMEDLGSVTCCVNVCTAISLTHASLLQQWRDRAATGQAPARRVLAEMLTPSGGHVSNCYKFISLVTGCSLSTISRVNEQMRATSGEREPPEHGLKRYFKDNPHKRRAKVSSGCSNGAPIATTETCSPVNQEDPSLISPSKAHPQDASCHDNHTASPVSGLITSLKQKIAEQEAQLLSQQQWIQQQLRQQPPLTLDVTSVVTALPAAPGQSVLGSAKPVPLPAACQPMEQLQVCSLSPGPPHPGSSPESQEAGPALPLLVMEQPLNDLPAVMAIQLVTPGGTPIPHMFSSATSTASLSTVSIETVSVTTALPGGGGSLLNPDPREEITSSLTSDLSLPPQELFASSIMVPGGCKASRDLYVDRNLLHAICDVDHHHKSSGLPPAALVRTPASFPASALTPVADCAPVSVTIVTSEASRDPGPAPAYNPAGSRTSTPPRSSGLTSSIHRLAAGLPSLPDQHPAESPSLEPLTLPAAPLLQTGLMSSRIDGHPRVEDSYTTDCPEQSSDLSLLELLHHHQLQTPGNLPAAAPIHAVQPLKLEDCSEQEAVESPSPPTMIAVHLEANSSPNPPSLSLEDSGLLSLPTQPPSKETL